MTYRSSWIAVVGEAPSTTGAPAFRTTTPCGRRMRSLFSGRRVMYLNLLDERQERQLSGKGSMFDSSTAASAAAAILKALPPDCFVVFAGHRVAKAFGISTPYFEVSVVGRRRCVVFPHPSRVNRWWNDPENVATAQRWARRFSRKERQVLDDVAV